MSYDKDEVQQDLAWRKNLPAEGRFYKHYKGGLYLVVAVSLMDDTGQILVTYRSLSRRHTWTRTLDDFQGSVEGKTPSGVMPRFTLFDP